MNVDWLNSASQRDIDQFKSVCNQLLSRTYVVRTVYRPDKGRVAKPSSRSLPTIPAMASSLTEAAIGRRST